MIVTMTARYSALHYKDAIAQATVIWREFMENPGADLPWDANIRIELGSDRIEEVGGTRVDEVPFGEAVLSVKINIEAE